MCCLPSGFPWVRHSFIHHCHSRDVYILPLIIICLLLLLNNVFAKIDNVLYQIPFQLVLDVSKSKISLKSWRLSRLMQKKKKFSDSNKVQVIVLFLKGRFLTNKMQSLSSHSSSSLGQIKPGHTWYKMTHCPMGSECHSGVLPKVFCTLLHIVKYLTDSTPQVFLTEGLILS